MCKQCFKYMSFPQIVNLTDFLDLLIEAIENRLQTTQIGRGPSESSDPKTDQSITDTLNDDKSLGRELLSLMQFCGVLHLKVNLEVSSAKASKPCLGTTQITYHFCNLLGRGPPTARGKASTTNYHIRYGCNIPSMAKVWP